MTDADWLAGKDPDSMLAEVADRLSDRQLHLVACGLARRLWEFLPEGAPREALDFCERNAGVVHLHADADKWLERLELAGEPGRAAARAQQREIVRTADPDADPESFEHDTERGPNPAAPYFQAACRVAGESVELAGEAAGHAVQVVATLLGDPPGEGQIGTLRAMVLEATTVRADASLNASRALKLKAKGDAAADIDLRKNGRVRYAQALQHVTDEAQGRQHAELQEAKERADRRATARLLHEIAGNPYRAFRFEPEWRTANVVGVARAAYDGRHFDRLPILADALLDADCDEEAVLRHCRATEAHAPEGAAHTRGCWVLDLILGHEPAYFALAPLEPPPPPPPVKPAPKANPPAGLGGIDRLLKAIQRADDDDED